MLVMARPTAICVAELVMLVRPLEAMPGRISRIPLKSEVRARCNSVVNPVKAIAPAAATCCWRFPSWAAAAGSVVPSIRSEINSGSDIGGRSGAEVSSRLGSCNDPVMWAMTGMSPELPWGVFTT